MRFEYNSPELTIVEFEVEDVITVSGGLTNEGDLSSGEDYGDIFGN